MASENKAELRAWNSKKLNFAPFTSNFWLGKPWRNGFIKRFNRTDKEELFTQLRFIDSEDRRYQLKLWEMDYNCHRPHQGLKNQIPVEVHRLDYPLHATSRGIS